MSQEAQIYSYLKRARGRGLTPIEALEKFGSFRLGARIHSLRCKGAHIETLWEEDNGKRYARYVLIEERKRAA